MSRSIWKGVFIHHKLNSLPKNLNLKVWSRASAIPGHLINKVVHIHNGKSFKKLLIKREHIGFKFGELCFTRTYALKKKK